MASTHSANGIELVPWLLKKDCMAHCVYASSVHYGTRSTGTIREVWDGYK